ncbi:hypothetical protein [Flavobacterium sp. CAN_S2]|uniref:hypothetical protein n=1 Tax=Flavobacterium sp. CAN_S2 TaxID=2787726 RepID=UPI0018CAB48E
MDAFPVRLPTLRAEKPIAICRFDGDTLETRLLDYDNLLGVVSLFEEKNMYSPMKKSAATTNQI